MHPEENFKETREEVYIYDYLPVNSSNGFKTTQVFTFWYKEKLKRTNTLKTY